MKFRRIIIVLSVVAIMLIIASCRNYENSSQEIRGADSATVSDSLEFMNEECGYKLVFPESWKGYYYVAELGNGATSIRFIGKSKTYSTQLQDIMGYSGRDVFYILNEQMLSEESAEYDSIREIGKVGDISYYYATETSAAFSFPYYSYETVPTEELDNGEQRVTNSTASPKTESELVDDDIRKAKSMFREIPNILGTFQPID